MQKELTPEQKEFVQNTLKHRKEKVEELAYQSLATALAENIPVFELPYYVLQRSRLVIEDALNKINWDNPKLQKARKTFLKACLKEMRDNIKPAPKKEVKDETDERDNECEPVVQKMVQLLLDEDLIFSDEYYFSKVLANDESIPLSAAIQGYADALDEKLLMIVSEHWRRASDKHWGVPKERVRFKMLDTVLKKD